MEVLGERKRQLGQGFVEYALILTLVSVVVVMVLVTLGQQVQNLMSNVMSALGT
jgi:Flp pilus assembly pilin Flp